MRNLVRIQVDDVQVVGEISHRSECDLWVRILSPYKNITNGVHIFYLARGHLSYISEYGDERAKNLLKEIFIFLQFLEENFQELKAYMDKLRGSDLFAEICRLKEKKKALRKALKSKGFDLRLIQLSHMKVTKNCLNWSSSLKVNFKNFLKKELLEKMVLWLQNILLKMQWKFFKGS